MDLIFKKYFWAVNLAAIAVLAYFVAGGVNDYLTSKLFAVPKAQASADSGKDVAKGLVEGRVPGDEAPASVLNDRNVFELDPKEYEDGNKEEEPEEEGPEEEPTAEGDLEESDLPIDLMGTMVSATATSMATLTVEGENKIAWVGSEFLEGKAKVVGIEPRHIVLNEKGKLKVVKLWSDKKPAAAPGRPGRATRPNRPTKADPAPRTPPKPAARTSAKKDWSKGVKKTGAYDYEIDRAMLDEQLADLSALGREARIVPNYKGGKYEGFKLVGVRPGSLYRAIGIRSGDVIKSINGNEINSPNKAIELFDKLKNSSNVELSIERRGQGKQLNYNIN